MPRRLLRDGQIVVDEWRYLAETSVDAAAPLIVPFDRCIQTRDLWISRAGPLGGLLAPASGVERLPQCESLTLLDIRQQ